MHVMIDLETLSSNSTAAIIQIGAVAFDLSSIGPTYKSSIDIADALKHGEASASTIKWWMEQSDAARASAMTGQESLVRALQGLNGFVNGLPGEHEFWAHATFDFPVLMNAYNATGVANAIPFRRTRDLRTLESIFGQFITREARSGVHHDALDDAMFQARHAQLMLREADTALQRRIDG